MPRFNRPILGATGDALLAATPDTPAVPFKAFIHAVHVKTCRPPKTVPNAIVPTVLMPCPVCGRSMTVEDDNGEAIPDCDQGCREVSIYRAAGF